jgi:hypothetical protein
MIIMVFSSHLGSEEMILPASRCTLRSSVARPATGSGAQERRRALSGATAARRSAVGHVECEFDQAADPAAPPMAGITFASGVAAPPEQAVLIRPRSS